MSEPGTTPTDHAARPSRRAVLRALGLGSAVLVVGGTGALGVRARQQGVFAVGEGPAYAPWTARPGAGARALVGAAVLAPSPHNAQAWMFRPTGDGIDVFTDPSRGTGAVDPFGREMAVGVGAAVENLVLAAQARGWAPEVALAPEGPASTHAARIRLVPAPARPSALADAIPVRHTNRYPYATDREVPGAALSAMAALRSPGAQTGVFWFSGLADRNAVGELVVAATEAFLRDPEQAAVDHAWFRQDWAEIQQRRDGITLDAAGLSDTTAALGKLLPAQSAQAAGEAWLAATRDRHTATAAAYGVVAARDPDDVRQRLDGGRLLERIHLWTAGNGLALHHMNQITERADRERQLGLTPRFGAALTDLLPTGWGPLATFRIGFPTRMPHPSPRRPVDAVLLG